MKLVSAGAHVWQSYDVTALFTTITSRTLIKIMSKNNLIKVLGVYAMVETLQHKMNKYQKRKKLFCSSICTDLG